LIEALLSIVVVGLTVLAVSELVIGATASSSTASLQLQYLYAAQAKMEELLAQPFEQLTPGTDSEVIELDGTEVVRSWTVSGVDIPGSEAGEDENAYRVTVTVAGFEIESIVVHSGGNLYKR